MSPVRIPIGSGARPAEIAAKFANRHGGIYGATGTGKSVTLLTLTEGFSRAGVPVFLSDVKGDLQAITRSCPTRSLGALNAGANGRVTLRIDSLGPDLMARLLSLSDAQSGVLEVAFAMATAQRTPLATLMDLKRLLQAMAAHHKAISARYGLVSPSSIAAIQRALLAIEREGAAQLFGNETFDVARLLNVEARDEGISGLAVNGIVTLFDATKLMRSPSLYAAVLLFIMTDLYERLPEVGDLDAPRLVLFFDEAHLLFADLAPAMLRKIEQVVRLIRSKGVGIYFASQSPMDIPPTILGQLGNRIQHALRGATLADQRAIRATAETLPINPHIDAAATIMKMGVGMALVSTIRPDGTPSPVDLVKIYRPRCLAKDLEPIKSDLMPEPVAALRDDAANLRRGTYMLGAFMAVGLLACYGLVRLVLRF